MTVQSLQVLIASEDRALLRQLSVFLDVAGYTVYEASGAALGVAALESVRPDFVIADWDLAMGGNRELCRAVGEQNKARATYFILLREEAAVRSSNLREMTQALEAGADDFLAKPLVHGEILARLLAATEVLGFERNWTEQARWDTRLRLLTRPALVARLTHELTRARAEVAAVSCVVLDLDYFHGLIRRHGREVEQVVLRAVAERLKEGCGESDLLGSFGKDRFCAVLPKTSEDLAVTWAEARRKALEEMEISLGDTVVSLTASFGVATGGGGELHTQELLTRAVQAMESAKISGRNVVVQHGEFEDEVKAWTGSQSPARLFDRTVARDVMTPCTTTLRCGQSVGDAASILLQTGIKVLPIVDEEGRIKGILEGDDLEGQPALLESDSRQPVDTFMKTDCIRLPENTSFEMLLDFFSRDTRSHIVIEQAGKPTGFVTRRSLACLSGANPRAERVF